MCPSTTLRSKNEKLSKRGSGRGVSVASKKMHHGALGPGGYGFLIHDDQGNPKLALCYKTQEEADDAAAHADQMLAKTIFLVEMGNA